MVKVGVPEEENGGAMAILLPAYREEKEPMLTNWPQKSQGQKSELKGIYRSLIVDRSLFALVRNSQQLTYFNMCVTHFFFLDTPDTGRLRRVSAPEL